MLVKWTIWKRGDKFNLNKKKFHKLTYILFAFHIILVFLIWRKKKLFKKISLPSWSTLCIFGFFNTSLGFFQKFHILYIYFRRQYKTSENERRRIRLSGNFFFIRNLFCIFLFLSQIGHNIWTVDFDYFFFSLLFAIFLFFSPLFSTSYSFSHFLFYSLLSSSPFSPHMFYLSFSYFTLISFRF